TRKPSESAQPAARVRAADRTGPDESARGEVSDYDRTTLPSRPNASPTTAPIRTHHAHTPTASTLKRSGHTRTPRTRTKGTQQVGLVRPNPLNNPKPADIKNDRPTSGKGNAHAHSGDWPGKRGRVRS